MKVHFAQLRYFAFIFGIFLGLNCFGQDSFYLIDTSGFEKMEESDRTLIDTSLFLYHQSDNDTNKLNIINEIVNECYDDNIWPLYNNVLKKEAYQIIAQAQYYSSERITKAVSMYALSINNEGYLSYNLGNFEAALLSFQNSLDLREKINDTSGISECYNNLGGIHYSIGNYDKAIENFQLSLSLKDPVEKPVSYATALNNIGGIFNSWKLYDSAFFYYQKSLKIFETEDDKEGIALSYHNLAAIQSIQGETDLAHLFFLKSIRINESLNDLAMVANSYIRLSTIYFDKKDLKKAELYGQRALNVSEELGYPELIMDAAEILYKIEKEEGKFVAALTLYEEYIEMKDSVQNIQTIQEIASKQLTYEFDKKTYADSVKYAEEKRTSEALLAEKDAKIERDFTLQVSMIFGLLMLVAISLIVLKALRNSKKYTAEIARQKTAVEQQAAATEEARKIVSLKNREIVDSINYAQRLQFAILPTAESLDKHLTDQALLYLPKDIVAGDFYWHKKKGNSHYFAVADCTGHGVPGAFVSILCANALDKALLDLGEVKPALILDEVNSIIVEHFSKSDEHIRDGMDIALCKLDKETNQLEYAGANNPLWIISNKIETLSEVIQFGDSPEKLFEIKANKQPIGHYVNQKAFVNHEIQLKKGDQIFLSSDGYPDQFGGPKGKKLKYKKLKELLLEKREQNLQSLTSQLKAYLNEWRGDLEQVDDICLWLIRI